MPWKWCSMFEKENDAVCHHQRSPADAFHLQNQRCVHALLTITTHLLNRSISWSNTVFTLSSLSASALTCWIVPSPEPTLCSCSPHYQHQHSPVESFHLLNQHRVHALRIHHWVFLGGSLYVVVLRQLKHWQGASSHQTSDASSNMSTCRMLIPHISLQFLIPLTRQCTAWLDHTFLSSFWCSKCDY